MNEVVKRRIEQIKRGEVPAGYKKTTVGIVPEEWEIHSLSRHLTQSCIPGTNGSVARKLTVKLWNKGVYAKREIHEGSESTTYYKRKSGQLIYSKLDFLNCAFGIIPEELDGFESTQDLPCFDIHGVNKFFLLSYITRRSFYTHFGMIADGGRKARRVGPEDMLSFPLLYPPLAEQEKIAEILAAQDRVIALKEKLLEEKKKQKKYLMQLLLTGKKRLPGFSGEWERRKLSEITFAAGRRNKDNLPLEPFAVTNDRGFIAQRSAHDDFGYMNNVDRSAYMVVKPNSFAYNPARINVGSIGYYDGKDDVIVSSLYEIFQTVDEVDDRFLWHWFKSSELMKWIKRLQEGSVRFYFYYDKLEECNLMMPSLTEQQKISECIDAMDRSIEIRERELNEEKQKKKALMQLLLTGIVRV